MKSKCKFVIIGVFLLLIAMALGVMSFRVIDFPAEIAGYCAALIVLSASICMGIAEVMFIRAKIVPKFLKYVFFFQWIVTGAVMFVMLIYVLCGGELVLTQIK